MPKSLHFIVEGRGQFPLDMLRYDGCWPHSSNDVALMDHEVRERRQIELVTYGTATAERWSSFGWRVVKTMRYA